MIACLRPAWTEFNVKQTSGVFSPRGTEIDTLNYAIMRICRIKGVSKNLQILQRKVWFVLIT